MVEGDRTHQQGDAPDEAQPSWMSVALRDAEEIFWRWSPQDGTVEISDGWKRLLGLQPKETAHWRDRVHPEDLPRVKAELDAVREKVSTRLTLECRLRNHDGSYRWMRIKAIPEFAEDQRVAALTGTMIDISEQRRTQDVFERLVRHNALILNAAGDGIYCLDADGKATFVNPAAARMLGSTVGELTGVPLCRFRPGCEETGSGLVHAEDCPVEETLRTALPHRVYDGEFRRGDDSTFPAEYVVSPIREHGMVSGAVVVFDDVTERRWSEEEIRRERRFSDGLIKSSIDGILAFDNELRYTIFNPAMERISGMAADEVIGEAVTDVFPFLAETGEIDHLKAALNGENVVVTDRPYAIPSHRRKGFFEARYAPIYDENGKILGGLGIIHDITEAKRRDEEIRASREKLVRSEKLAALGTLVSGVGHELRTPMSYINNHLYLMKMLAGRMKSEDPDMAPVADEILKRCTSSMKGIERMTTLLDDLRATYRPDEAEVKEVDLKDVVDEAVRLFSGAYEGPVNIERSFASTGKLFVEAGRIQQVVINLLNNAAEAMVDGGTVRVEVRPSEDGGEIVVSDDGPGMSEDVQDAIFHPFYTTKKFGSGLGLYLVKQIVDRHMATIDCESAPGKGTSFRIRFPRGQRPQRDAREGMVSQAKAAQALLGEPVKGNPVKGNGRA